MSRVNSSIRLLLDVIGTNTLNQTNKAFAVLDENVRKSAGALDRMSKSFQVIDLQSANIAGFFRSLAGLGGAAVGINRITNAIANSQKVFEEYQAQVLKLQVSLNNVNASDNFEKVNQLALEFTRRTTFTLTDSLQSINKLIQASGQSGLEFLEKNLTAVQSLAVFYNGDLRRAVNNYSKIFTQSLEELGEDFAGLRVLREAVGDIAFREGAAADFLINRLGGLAEAYAATNAGQRQLAANKLEIALVDLGKVISDNITPAIVNLNNAITTLLTSFKDTGGLSALNNTLNVLSSTLSGIVKVATEFSTVTAAIIAFLTLKGVNRALATNFLGGTSIQKFLLAFTSPKIKQAVGISQELRKELGKLSKSVVDTQDRITSLLGTVTTNASGRPISTATGKFLSKQDVANVLNAKATFDASIVETKNQLVDLQRKIPLFQALAFNKQQKSIFNQAQTDILNLNKGIDEFTKKQKVFDSILFTTKSGKQGAKTDFISPLTGTYFSKGFFNAKEAKLVEQELKVLKDGIDKFNVSLIETEKRARLAQASLIPLLKTRFLNIAEATLNITRLGAGLTALAGLIGIIILGFDSANRNIDLVKDGLQELGEIKLPVIRSINELVESINKLAGTNSIVESARTGIDYLINRLGLLINLLQDSAPDRDTLFTRLSIREQGQSGNKQPLTPIEQQFLSVNKTLNEEKKKLEENIKALDKLIKAEQASGGPIIRNPLVDELNKAIEAQKAGIKEIEKEVTSTYNKITTGLVSPQEIIEQANKDVTTLIEKNEEAANRASKAEIELAKLQKDREQLISEQLKREIDRLELTKQGLDADNLKITLQEDLRKVQDLYNEGKITEQQLIKETANLRKAAIAEDIKDIQFQIKQQEILLQQLEINGRINTDEAIEPREKIRKLLIQQEELLKDINLEERNLTRTLTVNARELEEINKSIQARIALIKNANTPLGKIFFGEIDINREILEVSKEFDVLNKRILDETNSKISTIESQIVNLQDTLNNIEFTGPIDVDFINKEIERLQQLLKNATDSQKIQLESLLNQFTGLINDTLEVITRSNINDLLDFEKQRTVLLEQGLDAEQLKLTLNEDLARVQDEYNRGLITEQELIRRSKELREATITNQLFSIDQQINLARQQLESLEASGNLLPEKQLELTKQINDLTEQRTSLLYNVSQEEREILDTIKEYERTTRLINDNINRRLILLRATETDQLVNGQINVAFQIASIVNSFDRIRQEFLKQNNEDIKILQENIKRVQNALELVRDSGTFEVIDTEQLDQELEDYREKLDQKILERQAFEAQLLQDQRAARDEALRIANDIPFLIGDTLNQTLSNQFSDFFESIVRGTESVADAFRNLAISILTDLGRLFVNQALRNFFSFIAQGASGQSGFGSFFAGLAGGFAEGGIVPGKYKGRDDKLALVHSGEGFIPAPVLADPESRQVFEMLRRGLGPLLLKGTSIPKMKPFIPSIPKFNEGGIVGKGNTITPGITKAVIGDDDIERLVTENPAYFTAMQRLIRDRGKELGLR